ncbi:MAG: metal-dependent hydrolase [Pyrinomonadaceae bacterium]
MDNLAHSLLGLTSAKAGLERFSPYSATVCVLSANAADADFVSLFFGDRWTLLKHHRGITHSVVGTLAIGILIPAVAYVIDRMVAGLRRRAPRIRFRGLLLASMIAAATHPLMDWTNNYGVRPLLPWSARWFYGDLVFIVDPYIWLVLGAVAFLLTSNTKRKSFGWSIIGLIATLVIGLASRQPGPEGKGLRIALVIWLAGIALTILLRRWYGPHLLGRRSALAALAIIVVYWASLAVAHQVAFSNTLAIANKLAASGGEQLLRVATMPTAATPFRWQSVAETDRAIYKYVVTTGQASMLETPARYAKPTGAETKLVTAADEDRRAQALLGFARFPLARVSADNCVGQALVQFADLRYTEPGAASGNFSVNIPVDCPSP